MVAGFERNVALEECLLSFTPMLGLRPSHTCDVISVVAEFMVDAAGVVHSSYYFHHLQDK
jgi:hypothetical protein